MASGSKGNCYLCGTTLGKTAMKNHILKVHNDLESGQKCYLLKIEGVYAKDYWIYLDVPVTATLIDVDAFLRKIWLECCGHLSAFSVQEGDEIAKTKELSAFCVGDKLLHEYDFGTTTEP